MDSGEPVPPINTHVLKRSATKREKFALAKFAPSAQVVGGKKLQLACAGTFREKFTTSALGSPDHTWVLHKIHTPIYLYNTGNVWC